MAKFTINTGSSPNDGTGDNLRTQVQRILIITSMRYTMQLVTVPF